MIIFFVFASLFSTLIWATPPTEKVKPSMYSATTLATQLGWINDPFSNKLCHGYYQEAPLAFKGETHASLLQSLTKISADTVEFHHTSTSTLVGHVALTQPFRQIKANTAFLNRDAVTQQPSSVQLTGDIQIREPGKLILAKTGYLSLVNDKGNFKHLLFRFSYTSPPEVTQTDYLLGKSLRLYQTHGWGKANQLKQIDANVFELKNTTYSTCPPDHPAWQIKARQLIINKQKNRGLAKNVGLYFFKVPLFYTPLFSFPLNTQRETGFLFPLPGYTNRSGYQLGLPFYWNLAPNYDFLFTPILMSQRGIQWNGSLRYLTPSHTGKIKGSILPDDKLFIADKKQKPLEVPPSTPGINRLIQASDIRRFITWEDEGIYNDYWSSHLFLNTVGDDYYFEDFPKAHGQITRNQLVNEASLNYSSAHWDSSLFIQAFQTLHPIDQAPVDNQYRRLPQFNLVGHFPEVRRHLNVQWYNEAVYFDKTQNPGAKILPVTGGRFYTAPHFQFPFYGYNSYFIPEIEFNLTEYNLHHQTLGEPPHITRFLPLIDIDTGFYFSRPIHWFNHSLIQTLEPHFFYLYVPYHNQNNIPLFDTDLQPFTYQQFFRRNRFTNIDRIGDANQLSTTLSSAFLNPQTGEERLRASLGMIIYFHDREVSINNERTSFVVLQNSVSPNASLSPLVGQVDYHLNHHWDVNGEVAWDPYFTHFNNSNINLQYKIDNQRIINLGYAFLRGGDAFPYLEKDNKGNIILNDRTLRKNNLNQLDFSITWPLSLHWQSYAHWSYNFSHGHPLTYFGGLAYNSCCWGIRLVGGREFNYLDTQNHAQYNNLIYAELSLRGLGNFAPNNPSGLLQRNIPGYKNDFGQLLHETEQRD